MSQAKNYMSTADNVSVQEKDVLNDSPLHETSMNTETSEYQRHQSRWGLSHILPSVGVKLVRVFVFAMIVVGCVVIGTSAGGRTDTRNSLFSSVDNLGQKIMKSKKHYSMLASSFLSDNLNNKKTSDNVVPGCEGTVLILRHCEKNGKVLDSKGNDHCSYLGYERSQFITTLFGNEPGDRWPAPSFLYAMSEHRPGRHTVNYREIETLEPLAKKLGGVRINSDYSSPDNDKLAKEIFEHLREGDLCGKLAVVSWRHSDIEILAQHLGCGPYEGCPRQYPVDSFDDVWQVKFVYNAPLPFESAYRRLGSSETSWSVYGSVLSQGFDPLKFSKTAGDYPPGGIDTGAAWKGS